MVWREPESVLRLEIASVASHILLELLLLMMMWVAVDVLVLLVWVQTLILILRVLLTMTRTIDRREVPIILIVWRVEVSVLRVLRNRRYISITYEA
jgi:hypothetical protein